MASMGCSGNEIYYSFDDSWGFDSRTEEEGRGDGQPSGFLGNQAVDHFFGQWNNDQLEFQFQDTSTSGSTPAAADGLVTQQLDHELMAAIDPGAPRRRRRVKIRKKQEDIENQRMAHIAVERNRRKQMNEYLSVIRTLMPESYAQRGDQASIVGGAINFVKDLEQQLQALGIQSLQETDRPVSANPTYSGSSSTIAMDELMVASTQPSATPNVEVSLVDSHASIKIQSGRRSRQLLGLVKGLQSVGLSVLHLNVHSVEGTAFYSLSVKVDDHCKLTSGDEIAAAVNQILGSI